MTGFTTPQLAALAGGHHAMPPGPPGPPGSPSEPSGSPAERCELCAEPLPAGAHRHLLDLTEHEPLCACGACAVLFDGQAAGGRRYRLIPRRRSELAGLRLDGQLWAALGAPVDLVFFSVTGESGQVPYQMPGQVLARYPGPAGALHATVPADSWKRVTDANPVLAELQPDVEALVVNRLADAAGHWILPLDDCYRLTALLREHWTGFRGGPLVWGHIAGFFDEMRQQR